MTLPLQLPGIPDVTPSFTFQNEGLGATLQSGIAGLINALAKKQELDQNEEELVIRQKQLEEEQARGASNRAVDQAQIDRIKFERKQAMTELKTKQEGLQKQREALRLYGSYIAGGGGDRALSEVLTQAKDTDVINSLLGYIGQETEIRNRLSTIEERKKPKGAAGGQGTTGSGVDPVAQRQFVQAILQQANRAFAEQSTTSDVPPKTRAQIVDEIAQSMGVTGDVIRRHIRKMFPGNPFGMSHFRNPRGAQQSKPREVSAADKRLAEEDPEFASWLREQGYALG